MPDQIETPSVPQAVPAEIAAVVDPQAAPAAPEAGANPLQAALQTPEVRMALAQALAQERSRAQAEAEAAAKAAEERAAQQFRARTWYESLPEEQKPFGSWALQMLGEVQTRDQKIAQLEAALQQIQEENAPIWRDVAFTRLSQAHGVEKALIEKYATTPEAARAVALAIAEMKKSAAFQQRVEQKVDAAPTPTQSASGANGKEAIRAAFLRGKGGSLEKYYESLRLAGLS